MQKTMKKSSWVFSEMPTQYIARRIERRGFDEMQEAGSFNSKCILNSINFSCFKKKIVDLVPRPYLILLRSPFACLEPMSLSIKIKMLATCDMSPASRKIFMLSKVASVGHAIDSTAVRLDS